MRWGGGGRGGRGGLGPLPPKRLGLFAWFLRSFLQLSPTAQVGEKGAVRTAGMRVRTEGPAAPVRSELAAQDKRSAPTWLPRQDREWAPGPSRGRI